MTQQRSAVRHHTVPALLSTLLGVALLVLGSAAPAHAHGRGSDATNMASTIRETPGLPGVSWTVYGGDEVLEVVNTTDTELVVLGYEAEPRPYLRVGPDGVFENRNSEATYINRERQGVVALPTDIDPAAEPEWVKISDGNAASWHDHRMHYMGGGVPRAVTDVGVETVVIPRWEVPFTYGGEAHVVAGDLVWVPGPSPVPWLLVGLLLTLPALAGLRTTPERDPEAADPEQPTRWSGLARPAALVLGAIVLLNLTNLVDDLFAMPMPVGARALAAGQTALFLAIGAFGAVRAWQANEGAFTALGVGSGAVLVGQGLLYWSVLGASQITSAFPDALARLTVGASLAQVIPLAVVAVVGTRALLPPLPDEASEAGAPQLPV